MWSQEKAWLYYLTWLLTLLNHQVFLLRNLFFSLSLSFSFFFLIFYFIEFKTLLISFVRLLTAPTVFWVDLLCKWEVSAEMEPWIFCRKPTFHQEGRQMCCPCATQKFCDRSSWFQSNWATNDLCYECVCWNVLIYKWQVVLLTISVRGQSTRGTVSKLKFQQYPWPERQREPSEEIWNIVELCNLNKIIFVGV